jgi:hypothetical protein
LSRIQNEGEINLVNDEFPYEHLFSTTNKSPWFVDISNYLTTGKLPQHLSQTEKHKIIIDSVLYSWVDGELFCTGPDFIIQRCVR